MSTGRRISFQVEGNIPSSDLQDWQGREINIDLVPLSLCGQKLGEFMVNDGDGLGWPFECFL